VGRVYESILLWAMEQARKRGDDEFEALRRFTIPVVGETFDGVLNDICASAIDDGVVRQAIEAAEKQDDVLEGNYGGGTGMMCHGFKGGTGTSSRLVPGEKKDYTVGVLVQANYGKRPDLHIGNVPVGRLLMEEEGKSVHGPAELPTSGKAVEGSKSSARKTPNSVLTRRRYNSYHRVRSPCSAELPLFTF
jgi:D-aminopeptidase